MKKVKSKLISGVEYWRCKRKEKSQRSKGFSASGIPNTRHGRGRIRSSNRKA